MEILPVLDGQVGGASVESVSIVTFENSIVKITVLGLKCYRVLTGSFSGTV